MVEAAVDLAVVEVVLSVVVFGPVAVAGIGVVVVYALVIDVDSSVVVLVVGTVIYLAAVDVGLSVIGVGSVVVDGVVMVVVEVLAAEIDGYVVALVVGSAF